MDKTWKDTTEKKIWDGKQTLEMVKKLLLVVTEMEIHHNV